MDITPDQGPHAFGGGADIADMKTGKLEIGHINGKEDTDIQTRYVRPHAVTPAEDVVKLWRNLTEEEQTQKRRALLKEHYAKFAVTAPARPADPWAKLEKDAKTCWNVALQNLSVLGETLRDLEGGASARHYLDTAT